MIQSIESVAALPSLPGRFSDPNAPFGVAYLNISGATSFPSPLGGIEADVAGDLIYLAINADADLLAPPDAPRMVRFDKASLSYTPGGLLESATAVNEASPYLTSSALDMASPLLNPTDHRASSILGMGIDRSTNDLYAAVIEWNSITGPSTKAIMRFGAGATTASSVVEFAAPTTSPQPLSPNYAPDFATTMMGPESVAHFQQPSATDVYYFTDGSGTDFGVAWAVQDLPYQRQSLSPGTLINRHDLADTNFFSDEMRIHANVLAGDFTLSDPTIHSDIIYLPVANRMVFCSGRPNTNGLSLVDDLNDNTEIGGTNSDFPQVSTVLTSMHPTCLCNVMTGGSVSPNQVLLANYDSGNNRSTIVQVTFTGSGSVSTSPTLDLTTPFNALPGRISEIAADSDGNIYAVDGASGVVYVIAENNQLGPTPTPTPPPPPDFSCFETNSLTYGVPGQFTLNSLISYARNTRSEPDVVTKLNLISSGNLETYLPRNNADHRNFYYINRPIVIASLDQLTVKNGDWLIFRSDADARAFLEIRGKLISDAVAPLTVRPDFVIGFDDREEDEIRYTSVQGFVSWLKRQGVMNWSSLGWTAPPGDDAAGRFEDFASAIFPFTSADPDVLVREIAIDHSGRWAGIFFNNSDVGVGRDTASRITYSRIEFAEAGVYCQDRLMDVNNVRDENALRIVSNHFERNLIGISIDGYSPLVASNQIRMSTRDLSFDPRDFGGNTQRTAPCSLNPGQRFPIGSSGTGVYITKRRLSSNVACSPLFTLNTIVDNARSGVEVQQPGIPNRQGAVFGSPSSLNRPKPLFGRTVPPISAAHEYSDIGMNVFARNAGFNIEYYVREIINDLGNASLSDVADMGAMSNMWESGDIATIVGTIRDGRIIGDLGEVILGGSIGYIPSAVDASTENYQ